MAHDWQRRRILIWGKTRPELSKTYREIVCTGGVFEDTRRLVRLYPIPLRFMRDSSVFKKYQWITANVKQSASDPRPESYKIQPDNIEPGDVISTGKDGSWSARADWIMNAHNCFDSVESLQDAQRANRTSLGIVRPAEIESVRAVRYSKAERDSYWERYTSALSQMELPLSPETGKPTKPLTPPDYRFKVKFRCDVAGCEGHNFSVLDWEVDALYFNELERKGPVEASKQVVRRLEEACGVDKDTHFFLGNISNHPQTFTIVGTWWPKKEDQLKLL